ncbi:hypothetical protein [Coraliomargarita parva]|uniref:hypothetical protein n=1 Tax=Coraliomargarita parva TaxID=3014050 RepID=UPI0022B375EA|nr:hypothetical protein [Coraliomargarita parva]
MKSTKPCLTSICLLISSYAFADFPIATGLEYSGGGAGSENEDDWLLFQYTYGGIYFGEFERENDLGVERFFDSETPGFADLLESVTDGSGTEYIGYHILFPRSQSNNNLATSVSQSSEFSEVNSEYPDLKGFTITKIGFKVTKWEITFEQFFSPGSGTYYTEANFDFDYELTYYGYKIPKIKNLNGNGFKWTAATPFHYVVQTSSDLKEWDDASELIVGDNTEVQTQFNKDSSTHLFYRIALRGSQ